MYLTALVLACVVWVSSAEDGCVCQVHRTRRGANWGMNYAGARIDAQEMRIAGLARSIDALAKKVSKDSAEEYKHVVHELGRRVEHIEGSHKLSHIKMQCICNNLFLRCFVGSDCSHDEFSCGKQSGQCISNLQVCDGKSDCESGKDESDTSCSMHFKFLISIKLIFQSKCVNICTLVH